MGSVEESKVEEREKEREGRKIEKGRGERDGGKEETEGNLSSLPLLLPPYPPPSLSPPFPILPPSLLRGRVVEERKGRREVGGRRGRRMTKIAYKYYKVA